MRTPQRRRANPPRALLLLSAALCCVSLAAQSRALGAQAARSALPERLTDVEFWKFVTDVSETGGYFQSDNFTSNEMGYPRIVSMMRARSDTGGAYLGVGPEQNFSYIAGIRPRIAFIVDIRRQAVMQHLMYKAVFELSKDRADFISLLFSKPRPAGLDSSSTIAQIWEAYWFVPTDTAAYPKNLARITDHLTKTHGFGLDSSDVVSLTYVYEAFYWLGPVINYNGYGRGGGSGTVAGLTIVGGARGGTTVTLFNGPITPTSTAYYGGVNFAALSTSTDDAGLPRSFLATEDTYRFLKSLHTRNLFIPVVGDFAGPKAIRGVGQYVRDHSATITAIYTSNVEQYLFQNNVWQQYYANVGTLPVTPASVFIRSGSSICPILGFLAAVAGGRVRAYGDATRCVP